jgi:hypothetical protein
MILEEVVITYVEGNGGVKKKSRWRVNWVIICATQIYHKVREQNHDMLLLIEDKMIKLHVRKGSPYLLGISVNSLF